MRCKNIFLNFFTLIKKFLIAYHDFYFDLDLKASNYSNNLIFVPIFEQTYSGKPVPVLNNNLEFNELGKLVDTIRQTNNQIKS